MPDPGDSNYWQATRHPWSCVLFVLPLLTAYEVGVRWLAPVAPPEEVRNGADVWLRQALAAAGVSPAYGAPALLLALLLTWAMWRRQDRPSDQAGVWCGMVGESAAYALVLLALSQGLWQVLQSANRVLCSHAPRPVALSWPGPGAASPEPALEQIIGFLGAGIYEETLFRLLLFAGLMAIFTVADFPRGWGFGLAASASALLFAGAHHLGPHGEPFNGSFFAFRCAAGLYFAILYRLRGFGIAVGAHAFYDVLVGLLLGAL
jgi:membrane protease YdiL (CAAX protease family)